MARGNGSQVTLAALVRVISQATTLGYFTEGVTFPHGEANLLKRLIRIILKTLVEDRILYVVEMGERIGFLEDSYLTLPIGIFGYLNLTGILKLWDEELKTHTGERE